MQEVSGSIPLSSTTIQTLAFGGGFFIPAEKTDNAFRHHFFIALTAIMARHTLFMVWDKRQA